MIEVDVCGFSCPIRVIRIKWWSMISPMSVTLLAEAVVSKEGEDIWEI